jgi:hypothetical protein
MVDTGLALHAGVFFTPSQPEMYEGDVNVCKTADVTAKFANSTRLHTAPPSVCHGKFD